MRFLQTFSKHHEKLQRCKHFIKQMNRTLKVAIKRLMEDTKKFNAQRVSCDRNTTVTPHQFYTSPADWAVEIEFIKKATATWSTCNARRRALITNDVAT